MFAGVVLRRNSRFFGRTNLRISLSRAKFDEEVYFEVRSAVAPQNNTPNQRNTKFSIRDFSQQIFSASKTKRLESSDMCFGKVSRRSEPCSRGKQPFEVSEKIEIRE